jgi:parallel beta-helix repeat protein
MLSSSIETIVVTEDTVLDKGAVLRARIVVEACHVVLDGNGATLEGPATPGDIESFEGAGTAVLVNGCTNVTIKNLKARAFETGLEMRDCTACVVEGCDFSDNYDNPKFGWGELPARGGIVCTGVKYTVFRGNTARNVWDGLHLRDSDDNLVMGNDFSHCSNVCAKLWNASRNHFIENDLSYGIRVDRAGGEVHARDSSSVLIESGSDDNFWYRNDASQGGDGIFIRPLNGWLSTGNVFIENDTSYANNNCIEAWSAANVYIRNKAEHGSYGFWIAGSDQTLMIANEASSNGLADGNHNAPEPVFGHGGIVVVGSSGTHTLLDGNRCSNNNGGGVVFRGDVQHATPEWKIRHWAIQNNVLEGNKWGIHGRVGDALFLGPNVSGKNDQPEDVADVDRVWLGQGEVRRPPVAALEGPSKAFVGIPVVFDASASRDPAGLALSFRWYFEDSEATGPVAEHAFRKPGLYGVGLTVSNGGLAAIASRDVLVASGRLAEIGTEGQASEWASDFGTFFDDPDAVEGRFSVRFLTRPLKEGLPWAVYPGRRAAGWDLSGKSVLSFWLKALNLNVFCWQNNEIAVRLISRGGEFRFEPAAKNWLWGPAHTPSRASWRYIEIPLAGDEEWVRATEGAPELSHVDAFAFALDSAEEAPFTVWIDGLTVR